MKVLFILFSKGSVTQSRKWADPDKDGARSPCVKCSFSQTAFCHHSHVSVCTCEGQQGLNQIAQIFTPSIWWELALNQLLDSPRMNISHLGDMLQVAFPGLHSRGP